jgi:hypothetical protein
MGVTQIDTMLMLLAGSRDMEKKERDIIMRLMIEGFNGNVSVISSLFNLRTKITLKLQGHRSPEDKQYKIRGQSLVG